ncbi:plastocyanin/azurin family copper-binding protein [Halorussus gelatinilyticus]|uniref:Plastocyanin/azurin family copper-binding protein n=1 Tax=Halorussus gelatinilyticus TaxID=2937524 RepID=A0A8U0IHJ8_9EURY|nr:plastocyanin/azurin family copper-binding protein [Halorussus gelatinilyticus]UPV99558.1 plastocyanin/azurin family copper-binding protein [Halorussus gelatinilyticus]
MSTEGSESVTRRGFMRAATGTAAAAGAAGTAAAESQEGSGGGGGSQEVLVGPGGSLVFEPAELTIAPGTTVNWVWESDNHNIVVSSQPEAASWQGTDGPPSKTYNTGHEYSHTFQATGTYEYYCQPHETAGMTASITVQEGGASSGGGGPAIPSSAKTLGIATTAALVFTLGLAYFFMKYGGDYGQVE